MSSGREFTGTAVQMARKLRADEKYLGAIDLDDNRDTWMRITGVYELNNIDVAGARMKIAFALSMETPEGRPASKQLLLKATNLATLRRLYGDDVPSWKGKYIGLFVDTCRVKGLPTACIRIRSATTPPASIRQAKPQTEETQPQLGDAAEPDQT